MGRRPAVKERALRQQLAARGVLAVASPARQRPALGPSQIPRWSMQSLAVTSGDTGSRRVVITIGGIPPNMTNNHRARQAGGVRVWREPVMVLARQACIRLGIRPGEERPVPIVRISYQRLPPYFDEDGAVHAAKPLIDGLVRGGLLEEDRVGKIRPVMPFPQSLATGRDAQVTRIEIEGL